MGREVVAADTCGVMSADRMNQTAMRTFGYFHLNPVVLRLPDSE